MSVCEQQRDSRGRVAKGGEDSDSARERRMDATVRGSPEPGRGSEGSQLTGKGMEEAS
jgi:hypothetical protein